MGKKMWITLVILLVLILGSFFGYRAIFSPKIISRNAETVLSCTDSDGGYKIYIKGQTDFERDEPGESSFYNSPDTCEGDILREGVCKGNVYTAIRVRCGRGYNCINGACAK